MERIYLGIVSGQFAQWSKDQKNNQFVRVTKEDEEGNVIKGNGYRRYFDEAEGKLVKVFETDSNFGTQTNIVLDAGKGLFIITIGTNTQSGQVSDYLKSFLLAAKSLVVGEYYKFVPYSIDKNRDGSPRTRNINGITVYFEDDNGQFQKFGEDDKYKIEYINKDGEVETEGEIPGLVFKEKRGKTVVEHDAQTDALLAILDELIEETKEYELPASSERKAKSAMNAFGDGTSDDDDAPSAAEAMGDESEEDYEDEPKETPSRPVRTSRTPAKIAKKKEEPVEEEEDQPEETKSTVERRPRRTPVKEKEVRETKSEDKPKTPRVPKATGTSGKSGLPF